MKKISIFIVMLCSSLTAIAQKKSGETIVFKGSTDTAYNGSVIVVYNTVLNLEDSAKITNGSLTLTLPFKEPGRYMLYSKDELKNKSGVATLVIMVVKPGTVEMKPDMKIFSNTVVKTIPENDLYKQYLKSGGGGQQKIMNQLNEKYGADFKKNHDEKDPKYKEWVADYNELSAASNLAEVNRLESFIKLHPDSFVALYLLWERLDMMTADKAKELYNLTTAKYKTGSYGSNIVKSIESRKQVAIGKIAPDFEQADTSGKMVKLSSFRGQYVLIDFWASWCGPCRAENPNLVKAYQQYHDKGFTILGVSLDQPGKKQAWLAAIHQDHLTWPQVSDLKFWNNAVAQQYWIRAIPQNFLLDREGKIIAANIRGDELTKKLAEIFQN